MSFCFVAVQNGSLHQKETVHDNDFEPYLTGQSTQVKLSTSILRKLQIIKKYEYRWIRSKSYG